MIDAPIVVTIVVTARGLRRRILLTAASGS